MGKEACDTFKELKVACKVGTPMSVQGVVATSLYIPEDSGSVHIYARYPYVASITINGDTKSTDANRVASSFKFPTATP